MEKPNFKKICFLNMQRLTNFPYIEADFDALTNYELLSKIVEYLNEVIANNNTQNESITELYTAFNTIKDYVDNYFDNLDVQNEINIKLDEMAEDGSLTQLISNYVDPLINEQNSNIESFKSNINNQISVINNKVNSATSGSPLPATSTSGMTDTDRIYVNTTDGYWYYYDGDSWERGGVYQSTQDQEVIDARENFNGSSYENLQDHLNTQFTYLYDKYNKTNFILEFFNYGFNINTGVILLHNYLMSTKNCLFAKKGSSIKLSNGYFRIFEFTNSIVKDSSVSEYVGYEGYFNDYVFTKDTYFRLTIRKDLSEEIDLWDTTTNELNSVGQELLENLTLNIYTSDLSTSDIENYKKELTPKFYIGNVSNTDGSVNWGNNARLVTQKLYINKKALLINNDNRINLCITTYDENDNMLSYSYFGGFYNKIISNCAYFRIGIRTYHPDTYFDNLTAEEIEDMVENIKVYTLNDEVSNYLDNYIDNFNGISIINDKYYPKNLSTEKVINIDAFTVINTSPELHDNNYATQGLTSDKKRYLYLTIDNNDSNPCGLIKFDLIKNEIVKSIYKREYGHGNGMTYIEKSNQLWITSYNYDDRTNLFRLSKINANTLESIEDVDLESTIKPFFADSVIPEIRGFSSLTYNKIHDKVVYMMLGTDGTDGIRHRALLICDSNNNPLQYTLMTDEFTGGLESDENYIYVNRPNNRILMYDWDLNYIDTINYTVTGESEGLVIMDKCIYTNINYQNVKLYKLKGSNFIFR